MNGDAGKMHSGASPPPTAFEDNPVNETTTECNSMSSPIEMPSAATVEVAPAATVEVAPAATDEVAPAAPVDAAPEGTIEVASEGTIELPPTSHVEPDVVVTDKEEALPLPETPCPPPSSDAPTATEEPQSNGKTSEDTAEEVPALDNPSDTTAGEDGDDAKCEAMAVATQTPNPIVDKEKMIRLMNEQIGFFFSRENWSSDHYLISQMDEDQYVPVYIVANCPQFKNITKDHSIILNVLKESPFVQLDEEKNRVRPNFNRCIVILREIPESTPVEEVEAMFSGENCPRVVNCEFVHNENWYVTFESDNDAQKAYRYLRETVKTFRDKPILARIKTKPVTRYGSYCVLPSFGGKGPAETRDGAPIPVANSAQQPPGIVPGPTNTPPPPGSFPRPQLYFAPPNSTAAPANFNNFYHSPAAYFYPNPMVHWTGNAPQSPFYDFNSLIHVNNLALRPPNNNNVRFQNNNNNRRPKHNRYDKNDARNTGNANFNNSNNNINNNNNNNNSRSHRQSPASNSGNFSTASTTSTTQSHSLVSNSNNSNSSSLNQSDANVGNQTMYVSYSYASNSTSTRPVNGVPNEKRDASTSAATSVPTNDGPNQCATPPAAAQSPIPLIPLIVPQNPMVPQPPPPPSHGTNPPNMPHNGAMNHSIPNQAQRPYNVPQDVHHLGHQPAPHYYQMQRDNASRNMNRGGRRRGPRGTREEEASMGNNVRPGNNPVNAARNPNVLAEGKPNHDFKQPQFDLKASAFPPLPGPPTGNEEIVVQEEKPVVEPTQNVWVAADTTKFSDVTKGTTRPRPQSTASLDGCSESSGVPSQPSNSPGPEMSAAANNTITTNVTSQVTVQDPVLTTASPTVPIVSSSSTTVSSTSHTTNATSSTQSASVGRGYGRDQRNRDDRRVNASGATRRENDRGRDNIGSGRGRGNQDRRDNRMTGNKENRPLPVQRAWREGRVDADGWINIGSKESKNHRGGNQHSYLPPQESKESKMTHLVNGDSTPPISPKLQTNEAKLPNSSSIEEPVLEKEVPQINNDTEHKTSYAKMALASKDKMPKIAAEIKEKEEQEKEKQRRLKHGKPQMRLQDKMAVSVGRDFKQLPRRDAPPRDSRLSSERTTAGFKQRDPTRPKSPK